MGSKPRAHVLLAEHVIEELRQLRGAEIVRPLRRDGLHGLDRAQVVVGVPVRERAMERALACIHGKRVACLQMRSRIRNGFGGLPVKPESCGFEADDRGVRPALHGLENGLDPPVKTQQPRDEIVRSRHGGRIIGGDVETARVFHRGTY
jgi:hypothetical protein